MKLTVFLSVCITISVLVTAHIGSANLPFSAWFCSESTCQSAHYILWNIRLPRLIAAILIGGALGISGATMQGLFRNPLVEAGIVGVSAGAGLSAALYIIVIVPWLSAGSLYGLAISSFIGGWSVSFLLYVLSRRHGELHIAAMLLIGIAISAFAGAITGLLIYIADDNQLRSLSFWSMGSLASVNWLMCGIMAVAVVICALLIFRESRALNALSLGEKEALYIGFAIEKVKKRLIIYVAILIGCAVAFSGGISFVGLVVPHLMRLIGSSDHRFLLPNSLFGGALLLLIADTLSRTIATPAEIPIGIFTAFFGAPFLAFLVWKSGVFRGR